MISHQGSLISNYMTNNTLQSKWQLLTNNLKKQNVSKDMKNIKVKWSLQVDYDVNIYDIVNYSVSVSFL